MKLYHGTSSLYLDDILQNGLKPRAGRKIKGNWKEYPSNSQAVYLTNAYPVYFAQVASKGDKPLIIEIDTALLNPWSFAPDEDVLFQSQKQDDNDKPHKHFQKNLEWWCDGESYKFSLKAMGNCCYFGNIPASAITRYLTWDQKNGDNRYLGLNLDPSISIINYYILGDFYRKNTQAFFGDAEAFESLKNDPVRNGQVAFEGELFTQDGYQKIKLVPDEEHKRKRRAEMMQLMEKA